ncbi:hypothetical protein M8494_24925 [Serratia ureilytica]
MAALRPLAYAVASRPATPSRRPHVRQPHHRQPPDLARPRQHPATAAAAACRSAANAAVQLPIFSTARCTPACANR